MSWKRSLAVLFFAVMVMTVSPMAAHADPISESELVATTESGDSEEDAEEEDEETEVDSWAGKTWNAAMKFLEDTFIGPEAEEREDIGDMKELEPYTYLENSSFGDDEGTSQVKDLSASFYRLIKVLSTFGMIVSVIAAGLGIAVGQSRKRMDIQGIVLKKAFVFMIICSITGIWSVIVPFFKMLSQ